eukprot:jgi/Mesen1/3540/ME000198S02744
MAICAPLGPRTLFLGHSLILADRVLQPIASRKVRLASPLKKNWICYNGKFVRSVSSVSASVSANVQGFSDFTKRQTSLKLEKGEGNQFSRSLSEMYPRLPCRICRGTKQVPCECCHGKGILSKGGYHRRNPVNIERIRDSKWTALEQTFGWRHFRIESKKRQGKEWFVEMIATCDENARFWVNMQNLKDRERWSMGWLQKKELEAIKAGAASTCTACKACAGIGQRTCQACLHRDGADTEGLLDIIEV